MKAGQFATKTSIGRSSSAISRRKVVSEEIFNAKEVNNQRK
jgi:hypothetical protein